MDKLHQGKFEIYENKLVRNKACLDLGYIFRYFVKDEFSLLRILNFSFSSKIKANLYGLPICLPWQKKEYY